MPNLGASPVTCHVGKRIAADLVVQVADEVFNGRALGVLPLGDGCLELLDAKGQVGGKLGIAQDAEAGVYIAGGVPRRSSASSSMA
jgi:glucokinase